MTEPKSRVSIAVFLALAAAAGGWWLYSGLVARSISTDDGISVLAADSIIRHGWPQLPSGLIYNRAYLAHYALAASIATVGRNDLGLLLPAWLASLGTQILLWRAGQRMFGGPWIGLAAAALVATSGWQAWYAGSPRMYGLLGFFATWTAVAAWRGLVEGQARHQTAALVAAALGIQAERGAALVLFAVVLAALVTEPGAIGRRTARLWGRLRFGPAQLAGLAALGLSTGLALYKPTGSLRPIVVEGGNMPEFFSFSLSPHRAASHLAAVDALFPFLLVGVIGASVAALRGPRSLRFVVVTFWAALLPLLLLSNMTGERVVLFLLPLAALAVAAAGAELLGPRRDARRLLSGAGVVLVALFARSAVLDEALTAKGRATHGRGSFIWPNDSKEGRPGTEAALVRLRARMAPDDQVLSSNPWTTDYYLGRSDGLVRQRSIAGKRHVRFDERRDEYFGLPIIDDEATLDALLAGRPAGAEAWLVRDFKADRYWSKDFSATIASRFEEVDHGGGVRIYRAVQPTAVAE
ncbi:MAG: hypothetical protein EXR71_12870 [Myxococcales bacterium]|nr:hypothetical protein [Myxococcales bacterium]